MEYPLCHGSPTTIIPRNNVLLENVIYVKEQGVAHIILNRPYAANALNKAMMREIVVVLDDIEEDDDISVVIVAGAGEKCFCAGLDIKEVLPDSPLETFKTSRLGHRVFDRIELFDKPILAAIHGYAFGGGLELAMACHIRIAEDRSTFSVPEGKLGFFVGGGASMRLPRLIGKSKSLEMFFSGKALGAEEACQIGLVHKVTSQENLYPMCLQYAANLCGNSIITNMLVINVLNQSSEIHPQSALLMESLAAGLVKSSEDCTEGITAFFNKRQPVFTGK
ncbi:MAG: enoyl-CoA hydratase-related protein [Chloroflexota bacterium]|nr:enoyl-CoA hydratase-related protein [Chloroflexota bacterium]